MVNHNRERAKSGLYMCPCCGYATLERPGDSGICDICFWEDEGQIDIDDYQFLSGPNEVSLHKARVNFIKIGAAEPKDLEHTRVPNKDDIRLKKFI